MGVIDDLLRTKLFLPAARPFLVPRPQLIAQLDAGLDGRLTLVSAPAGFGKTTLIGEWVRARQDNRDITFCWLSLDEADNDPVLFWSYVLAALSRAGVSTSAQLQASLAAPTAPQVTAVLTRLLNDLAAQAEQVVLVLDDYHLIDQSAIHEQVSFLLEHLSRQLHLVLLTRADPPLPLPRWRAQREMAEVRQADLRFDRLETAHLLNDLLALDLTPEAVAVLEKRTEGWVAGLQMAALALERSDVDRQAFIESFAGSHHYIMAYLLEEVLKQQPPEDQQFLEQTAVLRRMCASLCAAVTGNKNSDLLLHELYRRNLFFVPLDDAHDWYRTHHLFADLLASRLEKSSSTAQIEALHRRAAEWHEAHGLLEEAIFHALRCGDMAWAAQLVEKHARPMMGQGRLNTLLRWIDALPPEILKARPRLRLDQAWTLFLSGSAGRAKEILTAARQSLQGEPGLADEAAIRGELATLMANCAALEGDGEAVMAEVEEALALLPADNYVFRARALNAAGGTHGLAGDTERLVETSQEVKRLALLANNLFLATHAVSMIGESRFHQGRLFEAEKAYREIIALGEMQGGEPLPPFAGMGAIGLAAVQVERNELQAAARNLEEGLAISDRGGIGYKHLDAYCTLARLRAAQGDAAGAAASLKQAEVFAPLPLHKMHLAAYAVRFWLGQGDLAMAQRTFQFPVPHKVPAVVREVIEVTRARIALAEGSWAEVLALHESVVTSAAQPAALRMARVVEMTLLKALALEAQGERSLALESLEQGVGIAARQGALRTLLELGPDLAILLRALKKQGRGPSAFIVKLLRLIPADGNPRAGLVEPLSARELEVLRLIAAGKSNKEIADALVVTLNTIKKHSSHIYGKLGVNGRTQAVARARDLALL